MASAHGANTVDAAATISARCTAASTRIGAAMHVDGPDADGDDFNGAR
jgi:hypothetical protein